MDTLIRITAKSVYGAIKYYPANSQAELLCKLSGQKTLTLEQLSVIKNMGFTIEAIQTPLEGLI